MEIVFKKHKFLGLVLIALLNFLSSCIEDITNEIKLDSTYVRLVVDGSITTDTTRHKVILSKSGSAIGTDSVQFISNAKVTISDGIITYNLSENLSRKGTYETDSSVFGIPGRTYTLKISNVDVNNDGITEEYTASSLLRPENKIDAISIVPENSNDGMFWSIDLTALDNGAKNNYYLMKVLKNNILLTDSAFELYNIGNNIGFEGRYYDGYPVYRLSSNKPDERLKQGDKVTLEMDGITEDYANYLNAFIAEYYPKIPMFSGPSANIPTNVVPGDKAVGFFAAYSVVRKSIVYK
jgi:Domain of unknown function (DUF4249)